MTDALREEPAAEMVVVVPFPSRLPGGRLEIYVFQVPKSLKISVLS
jgi:hypothetical protein